MRKNYYIASCVFTAWHTNLSEIIQHYIQEHFDITVVRCCMSNFRQKEYADQMPDKYRKAWLSLPNTLDWENADKVYTICHNCTNLIRDTHPDIRWFSLWELILSDNHFVYPDYHGQTVYLQDCWRSCTYYAEQLAVRTLLENMNLHVIELPENHERTEFCGRSFYKITSIRASRRAPKNHPLNTNPNFSIPSDKEQAEMMREYCHPFGSVPVVCYCHYCLEGLKLGGAHAYHLAELLFLPFDTL